MNEQQTRLDDWLKKAFELALFLHGDREIAIKITTSAMLKLETASNAQFKRFYYTPTGRAESARTAARNRVSLNDLQLLQRLVYVESEHYEREAETAGTINQTSLLKYFLKHLVRISLKRNSFYATLALTRILHNYGTNEAMEIYNLVVQDPERVHDDYYFRSRKAQLMRELRTRFEEALIVVRGARGEERFQSCANSDQYREAVKNCFAHFTPWATRCVLPPELARFDETIKPLAFGGTDPDAEHRIELNRLHTILHPTCLDRIVRSLDFSPIAEKLEIPKFVMKNENEQNKSFDDWDNSESLAENELEGIKQRLSAASASRKAATCGLMRVLVDGELQAILDLKETDSVNFKLNESAELLEVRAGETILATRLLNFADFEKEEPAQAVTLPNGQQISFELKPRRDADGAIAGADCRVKFKETRALRHAAVIWGRVADSQKNAGWMHSPAFASVLLLFVVLLAALIYQLLPVAEEPVAVRDNNIPQFSPIVPQAPEDLIVPKPSPSEILNSNNQPKNDRDRNIKQNRQRETNAQPAPIKRAPKPEAPSSVPLPREEMAVDTNLPKINEPPIYRIPIRQTPIREKKNEVRGQRNSAPFEAGKTLSEIKTLYVEVIGNEQFDQQIWQQLQENFGATKRFVMTRDKDQADAALKISVRRESDSSETANALTSAVVRVVNANGFVIYPQRKNITGWKYVGKAGELPGRIVHDLSRSAIIFRK